MESVMDGAETGRRRLTGRKVLGIAAAWFGVVLAANGVMMYFAIDTFSGLVVRNPYVAAQGFDARVRAERALGWRLGADWEGGMLSISVADADGAPVEGLAVSAVVGRPATMAHDRALSLVPAGDAHMIPLDLAPGVWRVEILAERAEDGARFEIIDQVFVEPPRGPTQ